MRIHSMGHCVSDEKWQESVFLKNIGNASFNRKVVLKNDRDAWVPIDSCQNPFWECVRDLKAVAPTSVFHPEL